MRRPPAPAAVAARGWPPHLSGAVDLALDDDVCPWNSGAWRLVLDGGEGRLEPGGSGAVRMTMRGLAVWYAGAADPTVLRRAGLLAGDDSADAFLAAASAGPRPALEDYFKRSRTTIASPLASRLAWSMSTLSRPSGVSDTGMSLKFARPS